MIRNRSPLFKTAVVAGVASLLGLASAIVLPSIPMPAQGPPPEFLMLLARIKLFIATFNFVVLVALLVAYLSLYRDLPNKYTGSLVVLSLTLLLYAITSNPFIPLLFGFPPHPDAGPFVFIPDLFVGVAVAVLFYQSQT